MKKRIFNILLRLCALFVITVTTANINTFDERLGAEENREGMILVLHQEIRYWDGKLSLSTEYEYDSKGRVIKTTCYEPSAYRTQYRDYEYDENGNVIRAHSVYSYGDDCYWNYQYDAQGNILQTELYDSGGNI
ncbi:MAG: hypothetical protein K2N80_13635 [Lachnospiraceae bacterium]|nr:hypothetical protein [Lachnospiraceae bacterium]